MNEFDDEDFDDQDFDGENIDDDDECPGVPDDDFNGPEQEEAAERRKAFGAKCKRMQSLLAVHKLPNEWEDAKKWVRIWDHEDDPTHSAASYIDAGWTDPDFVTWLVMHEGDENALLEDLVGFENLTDDQLSCVGVSREKWEAEKAAK